MLAPLRRKGSPSSMVSTTASIAAPTGGWNAKDPLANMKPDQAIQLDNIFPRTSDVVLRSGASDHKTGFASAVRSLMAYNGPVTRQLFACTSAGIFDATSAGAVGASLMALSNGIVSHTNFNTAGGSYLIAVNGSDTLKLYNGTTWASITGASSPAITGPATSDFIAVTVFKRRIWLIKKDSMSAYYLPVDSVGGAAAEFPVGQLCRFGGKLVAIGSWTIDGGAGADDHLVLVTDRGEILVYQGTDPSSAATFALVGVYYIGSPVGGARSLTKYGGDLLLMTEGGLYPLSRSLQSATVSRSAALSDDILQPISAAASAYGTLTGWQVVVVPHVNALMINVPYIEQSNSYQFVMNTLTEAWCRFIGWNAFCFEVFEDAVYFGGVNSVAVCWAGTSDFGANINAEARQAFNYFGQRGRQKHIKLLRPTLLTDGPYEYFLAVDADFEDIPSYSYIPISGAVGGIWDTSLWDSGTWAADLEVRRDWQTAFSKPGFALSVRLRLSSKTANVSWIATDYVLERGGVL